jgi:hypothetical protein
MQQQHELRKQQMAQFLLKAKQVSNQEGPPAPPSPASPAAKPAKSPARKPVPQKGSPSPAQKRNPSPSPAQKGNPGSTPASPNPSSISPISRPSPNPTTVSPRNRPSPSSVTTPSPVSAGKAKIAKNDSGSVDPATPPEKEEGTSQSTSLSLSLLSLYHSHSF